MYYFALFGSAPPRYYPSTSNIANSTCIPSEVYTNLHISTNTVTWQNNSTGNLCQILNNVCNQQLVQQWQLQLQQFINVNASLYYADPAAANSAFNSSVSQCRSMVKSLNPATTYSQLDTKCVSLNAYNSSATTFKFGCCESWSNNQTGRALPSFYTPLSICPGSDMLKQSCPAPTIGITHASAGA